MSTRNLLIVDDDAVLANRMGIALSARGFQVRKAFSVSDALAAIREEPPGFAVIDLRLGDGSGLDVLSFLQASHPAARVIVLSGYANIPCTVSAIRAGAFDCLPKPADPDDVAIALLTSPGSVRPPPTRVLPPSEVRRLHIEQVLKDCGENISETSRRLGMHRRTLQRILGRSGAGRRPLNVGDDCGSIASFRTGETLARLSPSVSEE
jgi:two-component system response regulator RegA